MSILDTITNIIFEKIILRLKEKTNMFNKEEILDELKIQLENLTDIHPQKLFRVLNNESIIGTGMYKGTIPFSFHMLLNQDKYSFFIKGKLVTKKGTKDMFLTFEPEKVSKENIVSKALNELISSLELNK